MFTKNKRRIKEPHNIIMHLVIVVIHSIMMVNNCRYVGTDN